MSAKNKSLPLEESPDVFVGGELVLEPCGGKDASLSLKAIVSAGLTVLMPAATRSRTAANAQMIATAWWEREVRLNELEVEQVAKKAACRDRVDVLPVNLACNEPHFGNGGANHG